MKTFMKMMKDENGGTAIEYGLIAALIAIAIIAGSRTLGNTINNVFTNTATQLNTAR